MPMSTAQICQMWMAGLGRIDNATKGMVRAYDVHR